MPYWSTALGENDLSNDILDEFKIQVAGLSPKKEAAVMELTRYFNRDNVIYAGWDEKKKEFRYVITDIPDSKAQNYSDIILPIVGFFKLLMDDMNYVPYITRRHAFIVKKFVKRLLKNEYLRGKYKPSLRSFLTRINKAYKLTKKFESIHRKEVPAKYIADKNHYLHEIGYKRIGEIADDIESQFRLLHRKQYYYGELDGEDGIHILLLLWKDHKGRKFQLRHSGKVGGE